MNWLRRIFCRHDWCHYANLYGDQINSWGGKRSLWECSHCGKLQARDALLEARPDAAAADEIERLRAALLRIQRSGNHNHPAAIWMQKVAAHALYKQQ